MSDSEEEAGGFGSDEEEEEGGFGEAFSEDEEDEEGGGFGEGAEFEAVEEEEEVKKPAPAPAKRGMVFEAFAKKYFKNGNDHKYSFEPIKGPLLAVKAAGAAVTVYKLVCQFMGITAKVGKSSLSAMQAIRAIISPALKDEQLKDELYCHIMKLQNNNPAPKSRARGTILLGLCLGCFAPSKNLYPVLKSYIDEGPKGFVAYCNVLLKRTIANGQRMEPPCQLELSAVKQKQFLRIQVVVDLCTGKTASARLDPASTMSEWVTEISHGLGFANSKGWSIYIDRFGNLESLRGGTKEGLHIMDMISKMDQKASAADAKDILNVTGQFSFRKELFEPKMTPKKDVTAMHIMMHQIQYGIKLDHFKSGDMAAYNTLGALMYYSLYGDDLDDKRLKDCLGAWFPARVFAGPGNALKDRMPQIEKLCAKGDFARKAFTTPETEALVIQYALDTWGKVDSFSADKCIKLYPN